ncbi:hypothetical protein KIN20_028948 [Parelaphostrongylus tenuis]|uniref:Uncharacterized protein n=1 Tax=Parelaphostrongylus tenuis TaxID=148309 RepID=A0AAD5R1M6_PARTN|nr:hypothetical protein KIN20_028948 [Parelaphostrongylus tenuis]
MVGPVVLKAELMLVLATAIARQWNEAENSITATEANSTFQSSWLVRGSALTEDGQSLKNPKSFERRMAYRNETRRQKRLPIQKPLSTYGLCNSFDAHDIAAKPRIFGNIPSVLTILNHINTMPEELHVLISHMDQNGNVPFCDAQVYGAIPNIIEIAITPIKSKRAHDKFITISLIANGGKMRFDLETRRNVGKNFVLVVKTLISVVNSGRPYNNELPDFHRHEYMVSNPDLTLAKYKFLEDKKSYFLVAMEAQYELLTWGTDASLAQGLSPSTAPCNLLSDDSLSARHMREGRPHKSYVGSTIKKGLWVGFRRGCSGVTVVSINVWGIAAEVLLRIRQVHLDQVTFVNDYEIGHEKTLQLSSNHNDSDLKTPPELSEKFHDSNKTAVSLTRIT